MGLGGAEGVKNFSVGICDGASSTARSSLICDFQDSADLFILKLTENDIYPPHIF